ncbi:PAS domain-containing protein [Lichenibacterium dinghuense]|uniref:PAS domain-containing protein n=1 Tax=Lichenibacterium dinghuense TaxID=2895977 RepID=UPI001EFFBABF|nr:PAS domain-containing protein [Lichenibacterium sp. 6Y81]
MSASASFFQNVLRLVEEQGQIGFWWHDLASGQITASPGLARISGVPASATRTRQSMLNSIHPQDRPYQADMMDLIDTGHPLRREFRIVRPDGTIRWVSSRIDVVLGDDGKPVRFVGVVADVTERREAQRAVEFNHGRRAAFLEATSALTWIADLSGQSIDYTAWCELTGMLPEHCTGQGWLDAVHPNDRDRVRAAYRNALARNEVYNVDYRVMTRDGAYRWYNARSAPVRDATGAIREWQGVLLPIDEHHRPVVGEAGSDEVTTLTGAQIRGARGLLDWSLAQLAQASGVSVSTIKRMEDGSEGTTRPSKAEAVRRALQTGGVSFRTVDGVTWISR